MAGTSAGGSSTFDQQRQLLVEYMDRHDITQVELATKIGRTPKHVNRVLQGHAGTHELDYWAWVLGLEYKITMVKR